MKGRTEDGWMNGWHFFKGLADRQTYMISKVSKIIVYWAVHGRQTQKSTHARTHAHIHAQTLTCSRFTFKVATCIVKTALYVATL